LIPIRRVESADAAVLAELAAATFTETFGHLYAPADLASYLGRACTESVCRELIANSRAAAWFAEPEGSAPVAFVTVADCKLPVPDLEPTAGEIRQLYVRSGFQSAGLGARLMDVALVWLEEQGRRPLYVGVWSENHRAQRFYARYGFVKVGEYGFQVGKTVDRELILRAEGARPFRGSA